MTICRVRDTFTILSVEKPKQGFLPLSLHDCLYLSLWPWGVLLSIVLPREWKQALTWLEHHACSVTQSCLTLSDPMDHSPPGSTVHVILQARILEWVATPSSRVYSITSCLKPAST